MSDGRVVRQLEAIAEVVEVSGRLGVTAWLRGGWAMDFFLGELTRPHVDIDWFVWDDQAARLAEALVARGWALEAEPPHDRQMDLSMRDVEQSLTLLGRDESGNPVVPAGPWAGAPWPETMLDGPPRTLAGITCRIIAPEAQIEIKRMLPVWNPALPRRPKDATDIARLEAALRR
ncbi:nucleotidyltransferase domain-containing protein [Actinoplanes teichomyceticus]|uniref:nucleotidyltransferase domain-containing protein n=1 Tax=Actinoplanes teichomyceticus TaxID=1867 RepID=UPI0035562226